MKIFGVSQKSLSNDEAEFFKNLEVFAQITDEVQFDQKPHYHQLIRILDNCSDLSLDIKYGAQLSMAKVKTSTDV